MTDQEIIARAIEILEARMKQADVLGSPNDARNYLRCRMGDYQREVFAVLFLNTRHRVTDYVELFQGTIDGAAVYPREIAREALERNAAAVILAHNHPSGDPEPSEADRSITIKVQKALALLDIRLLDHIVVSQTGHVSLAERGWV